MPSLRIFSLQPRPLVPRVKSHQPLPDTSIRSRFIKQSHQKNHKDPAISAHHDFKAQVSHVSREPLRGLPKFHGRNIAQHSHQIAHISRPRPHVSGLAALSHQSTIPLHCRRNLRQAHPPSELQQISPTEIPVASATKATGRSRSGTARGEVWLIGVGKSVSQDQRGGMGEELPRTTSQLFLLCQQLANSDTE